MGYGLGRPIAPVMESTKMVRVVGSCIIRQEQEKMKGNGDS